MDLEETTQKIENLLLSEIRTMRPDAILFSGGIDSSLLAALAFRERRLPLVTVIFGEESGPDLQYSTMAAKRLLAKQHIRFFDVEEAKDAARQIVRLLERFDPDEIRNDLVIQLGLEFCKELGYNHIMTGDGADELFAGYGFLLEKPLEKIDSWIRMNWCKWRFTSKDLALNLGMEVLQPFLACQVIEYGIKIPPVFKALDERGELVGKYVLRKILHNNIPGKLAWRKKSAIEYGSGANSLSQLFAESISDIDYWGIKEEFPLMSREQAFYYMLYDECGLKIPQVGEGEIPCPLCGAPTEKSFCKICGNSITRNQR